MQCFDFESRDQGRNTPVHSSSINLEIAIEPAIIHV